MLSRRSGDFDAAEDAVQEALIAAVRHWPDEGVPPNPTGWLLRTAGRRLVDQRRSEQARAARELETALLEPAPATGSDEDEALTVLYLCCHPSLTPTSAIALTLRAVGGLTTAQVARAFLVPDATMAQRITRAKRTIKASGVGFRMPAAAEQPAALRNVCRVLYLMFIEGYASSAGTELHRTDLTDEAIRLARMVNRQLPEDPEAAGLLALMLLLDARRAARTHASGEPIPLPEQDRTLWDRGRISEGTTLLNAAVATGRVGEYQLQAAIAAVHDRAPRGTDTDWPQILALYGLLEQMTGSPVVRLNRAVAIAMVHGPAAGLTVLDGLDGALGEHHRLEAVRAYLLEMAGDFDSAVEHYRAAARLTPNLPEQRYLAMRAARLRHDG